MCETQGALSSVQERQQPAAMVGEPFDPDKLFKTPEPQVAAPRKKAGGKPKQLNPPSPKRVSEPVRVAEKEPEDAPPESIEDERPRDTPDAVSASSTEARQRVATVIETLSTKARKRVGDAVFKAISAGEITSVEEEKAMMQRLGEAEIQTAKERTDKERVNREEAQRRHMRKPWNRGRR